MWKCFLAKRGTKTWLGMCIVASITFLQWHYSNFQPKEIHTNHLSHGREAHEKTSDVAAQNERLTTLSNWWQGPHDVRNSCAVSRRAPTLGTVGTVGVWAVAYSYRQGFPSRTKPWVLSGPRHRGLATMRMLFTCSFNWELRREHGVYGTLG